MDAVNAWRKDQETHWKAVAAAQNPRGEVYVICVNLPGCLPEDEPYAIRGKDAAYACAQNELEDCDSLGYSRAEWSSALDAGGASVYLNSGYVLEVTPLDSLGLDDDDRNYYLNSLEGW